MERNVEKSLTKRSWKILIFVTFIFIQFFLRGKESSLEQQSCAEKSLMAIHQF